MKFFTSMNSELLKVIFLDIDGVMNSCFSKTSTVHENLAFDPNCVAHLYKIIAATDAKVVLSSSWRIGETIETISNRVLSHYGLDKYLIGMTPFQDFECTRGEEIKQWLSKNSCDSFVILDDDNDMGSYTPYLVRTKTKYGLQAYHVQKAIDILNRRRK